MKIDKKLKKRIDNYVFHYDILQRDMESITEVLKIKGADPSAFKKEYAKMAAIRLKKELLPKGPLLQIGDKIGFEKFTGNTPDGTYTPLGVFQSDSTIMDEKGWIKWFAEEDIPEDGILDALQYYYNDLEALGMKKVSVFN